LIDPSIVRCADHRRSAGPLYGAGPLAQYQSATPKTGLITVTRQIKHLNYSSN